MNYPPASNGRVRNPVRKICAASGLIAAAAFLVLYTVAMSIDGDYTFYENYLSDLGVGEGAWAFNSAVIVAGALMALFALAGLGPAVQSGVARRARAALAWAGPVLLAIGGVFLVLIGVFTEDAGDLHGTVSVGFFLSSYLGLVALVPAMRRSGALGISGLFSTIVTVAIGTILLAMGFNPQTETIAVMIVVAWGITASGILLLRARPTAG